MAQEQLPTNGVEPIAPKDQICEKFFLFLRSGQRASQSHARPSEVYGGDSAAQANGNSETKSVLHERAVKVGAMDMEVGRSVGGRGMGNQILS